MEERKKVPQGIRANHVALIAEDRNGILGSVVEFAGGIQNTSRSNFRICKEKYYYANKGIKLN